MPSKVNRNSLWCLTFPRSRQLTSRYKLLLCQFWAEELANSFATLISRSFLTSWCHEVVTRHSISTLFVPDLVPPDLLVLGSSICSHLTRRELSVHSMKPSPTSRPLAPHKCRLTRRPADFQNSKTPTTHLFCGAGSRAQSDGQGRWMRGHAP